jgi:hypothetical protein
VDPAEVWHERVEDALTVELGLIARRALEPYASSSPRTGVGGIAALEEIGLLEADAAVCWRDRFAAADRPFSRVELDDALRERLYAYLGGLTRAASLADGDVDGSLQRLDVVLRVFRQVGLIDDDELGWWLGLPGIQPAAGWVPRLASPSGLGPFVRSVAGPPLRRRGLRVISVDLFEHGLYVRLHLGRNGRDEDGGLTALPDDDGEGGPLVSPRFELLLRDDLGTLYRGGGRGGGGRSGHVDGPLSFHVERAFAPAVPPGARALSLYADDLRIPVRL